MFEQRLAEDWLEMQVSEVLDFRSGNVDPQRYANETFELYSMPAYDETGKPEIVQGRNIGSSKKEVYSGDVLFARLNPRIPRVWSVGNTQITYRKLASTDFVVLTDKQRPDRTPWFDTQFLRYQLLSPQFLSQVTKEVQGATGSRQRIRTEYLETARLSIPDLGTQQRIVARIEALLAEVREMRELQTAITADTSQLMRSVLAEVFPVNPKDTISGWQWVQLSDLGEVVGGGTPRKSEMAYWGGTIPWVSPKDMKTKVIEDTQDHVTGIGIENSSTKLIPAKSILLVFRSGILAHSLPIAIAGRDLTINQDMKAIILRSGLVSDFVAYALEAREQRFITSCVKKGPTVHSIVGEKFWQERIPVPNGKDSLTRQQQIASYLDNMRVEIKEMNSLNAEDARLIGELEQAVLNQAFRGEL